MLRKFRFFMVAILMLTLICGSVPAFATDSADNTSFIKAQDVSSTQIGKIASAQSKLNLEGSTEISDFVVQKPI